METGNISADGFEAPATETTESLGRLGIPYLYRYWEQHGPQSMGPTSKPNKATGEWDLENTLLSGLGLNLLETSRFLHGTDRPDFDAFEEWILMLNGGAVEEHRLTRLRDALAGNTVGSAAGCLNDVPGLNADELAFWDEHGYVVVHDAVDVGNRDAAAAAIYEFLEADAADPDTWYGNKYGKSIWVPLLRHAAFLANRKSPRLVKAFAQLWGREDLWSTVDQGGFNAPERRDWMFPGPHVHWDMTIAPPHCFGMQGILYLTDTPAEQGRVQLHSRLSSDVGGVAARSAGGRKSAQSYNAASGVHADCGQGGRPGDLASGPAARQLPESRNKAAGSAVHHAAPHALAVYG